jgi:3-phosphoshikimate 1-carboxyvinyltransferase
MNKGKSIAHVTPLPKAIEAQINVPGSKSFTNRALIIAALANGKSILSGCSNSNDSLLLIKALQTLGIEITSEGTTVTVNGNSGKFKEFNGKIDVEDAGTVMRFLTVFCCLILGDIILEGSSRMHQRPIKELVDALLQLGADITYLDENGYPPIKIKGGKLHGGKVEIDASKSSQFVSALLMIAPLLDSDLEVNTSTEIASAPYIDMTVSIMKHFGVFVEVQDSKYPIKAGSSYSSSNYTIEGDASSASYFFALAAITKSTIRINNLSPSSLQGDVKFVDLLAQMGCKVVKDGNYTEVTGSEELNGITTDMKNMQDVAQTLAIVAAFAKSKTILTGLKNLEIKETKRLTALQTELTKMGIECSTDGEQITIQGGNPKGALINTYNDHRMAMAFAIAGTRVKDILIESPGVVKKSFPDFWDTLREIGVNVRIEKSPKNIVLIGFMGSGKTTISRLLAKKLQLELVETDDEIIKRSGLKSVNEIFEKKGEAFFRELEKEVISEYADKSNHIISCGGGVIENPENIKALKENSKLIFLSASFETITGRIKNQLIRPLFKDAEKAKELYTRRLPIYKSYSDITIETDNLTPEQIVKAIENSLQIKTCLVVKGNDSPSLSPAMHSAAYKALGIDSEYTFQVKQVKPEELAIAIQNELRTSNIHAFAVTIPYKETIIKYLDETDETAKKIGAVNTVINNNGKLKGYNTDWQGAINTLLKFTSLKGKKVAILGSGGTARAVAYGLSKEACEIIIYARNENTATAIANQFGCKTYSWDERENATNADIIINTTPIGRENNDSPLSGEGIDEKHVIFDVNYKKGGTPLLNLAKSKNAIVVDGLEMLLQQGMLQFELYTGLKAPEKEMREALYK